MPRQIDDPIEVVIADSGEPSSFIWQRFEYEVTGQPQAFFRRPDNWWSAGRTLALIDQELWRVTATRDGDEHTYDLRREPEGWLLSLQWE